jgi:hypothetical protein
MDDASPETKPTSREDVLEALLNMVAADYALQKFKGYPDDKYMLELKSGRSAGLKASPMTDLIDQIAKIISQGRSGNHPDRVTAGKIMELVGDSRIVAAGRLEAGAERARPSRCGG